MSPKTPSTTTLAPPKTKPAAPKAAGAVDPASQWKEALLVYPFYAALTEKFDFAPSPYPAGEAPPSRPTRPIFEQHIQWMNTIDSKVLAYQIRQIPPETLNGSEQCLRAFILRQLRKPDKTTVDRDKIDLLLVQYFALCAPEELYREEIALEQVAGVLSPVLPEADPTPLEWCAPLDEILEKLSQCKSLRDLLEHGLFEQGRMLKDSAGVMFYDPAALVAFCRFNFVLRRTFIRLLHADLAAVKGAVAALEAKGIKTADCRRAGFSAAETTAHLRHFCENWRQSFQKDYTESSVTHAFEQLLALRADLEEVLARHSAPAAGQQAKKKIASKVDHAAWEEMMQASAASVEEEPATRPKIEEPHAEIAPTAAPAAPSAPAKAAPARPAAPAEPAMDADKCMETIWEQLIAAPPSRGRSMSTVVLKDTKVLLSSWEVAAFVAEGGQEAEDLRRAVVARALLSLGTEERKRSGDQAALVSALELARSEFSYFQGRVEQAKRSKNTEAAVNLGISTKRLLSFIEEAEKLQP
ncbi:MAG TPA: hypothetical protein VJS43_00710 [Candidatus Acidoferrales bacterium]|nr:hypothetical protein [Candidatus Acidoferrales bacterium]